MFFYYLISLTRVSSITVSRNTGSAISRLLNNGACGSCSRICCTTRVRCRAARVRPSRTRRPVGRGAHCLRRSRSGGGASPADVLGNGCSVVTGTGRSCRSIVRGRSSLGPINIGKDCRRGRPRSVSTRRITCSSTPKPVRRFRGTIRLVLTGGRVVTSCWGGGTDRRSRCRRGRVIMLLRMLRLLPVISS